MKTLASIAVLTLVAAAANAQPVVSFATTGNSTVMTIDPNTVTYDVVDVVVTATSGSFTDADAGAGTAPTWAGPTPSGTDTDFSTEITDPNTLNGVLQGSYDVDTTKANGAWANSGNDDLSSAVVDWLEIVAAGGTEFDYTITFVDGGQQVAQVSGSYTVPAATTAKVPAVLPIGLVALCGGLGLAGVRVLGRKP